MKAFIFLGQGCQKEGLGKDLYEKFLESANDFLGIRKFRFNSYS